MIRHKEARTIYLTKQDLATLDDIAIKKGESKSAIIRKLVQSERHIQAIEQIELNNKLQSEYLKEFNHIGQNLNQIAFWLNADITKESEANNDFKKTMQEFKIMINKFYDDIEKFKIDLNVNHIKKPRKKGEK